MQSSTRPSSISCYIKSLSYTFFLLFLFSFRLESHQLAQKVSTRL
jgi:hypothetical protein